MSGTMREDEFDLYPDLLDEDTASEGWTTAENAPAAQSRDFGARTPPTDLTLHQRFSCISPTLSYPPDRMTGPSWPVWQIPTGSG